MVERFLSAKEQAEQINNWKKQADKSEKPEYGYFAVRVEGGDIDYDLKRVHRLSFIKLIRSKIEELGGKDVMLKSGQKIKFLDVGGGAALYAAQIREEFGDLVKVYTTGLRKRAAKIQRARLVANGGVWQDSNEEGGYSYTLSIRELKTDLHKNDLKWRSILQLSDFPEFDFIVDSYGESFYRLNNYEKYLSAVISKLLPGGMASLNPFIQRRPEDEQAVKDYLSKIGDITFTWTGAVLRIYKKNNDDVPQAGKSNKELALQN